ncbi:Peptidase family M23 [Parelusimicrobium proximum]|uniref:M23 family metallopeptidase n=1 Tax=Parelusimicrobium proximum TaxID=3228953 RepID=UPI003D16F326
MPRKVSKALSDRVDILVTSRFFRSKKISVSAFTLVSVAVIWLVLTIGAFYILVRGLDYSMAKADNNMLKAKLALIAEELARGRKYLELTQTTDSQMRQMLGMPDAKNVNHPPAFNENMKNMDFTSVFNSDVSEINENDFKEYLVGIEKAAETRLASFQEIAWYFHNRKTVLNSTPSIRPSKGRITSGFGYRLSPFGTKETKLHSGLDFADKPDSPIIATADGVVRKTGWAAAFGQAVLIDHGFGYSTMYGHVTSIKVKAGDVVKRGTVIATMGTTGRSTGTHLHYEVWKDGTPVDPRKYFQ